ncbi:MAG: hypothetical protein LBN26_06180 [Christensenellaceae bacterium]|jgi:stage III sporulation protein AG|nr:hypothetical protein [Christensenellaceae bacterium]
MDLKGIMQPLKKLAERMKADKRLEICVYGVLAILGILLYTASCGAKGAAPDAPKAEPGIEAASEADIERRLEQTLSCIRGAGEVRVMITYATGAQLVPAMSTDTQVTTSEATTQGGSTVNENRTESSRPATAQSGDKGALVLTERMPEVRGVIVVAEGAANIAVKLKLQAAVQTVLGIKADCIEVFEMSLAEYQ